MKKATFIIFFLLTLLFTGCTTAESTEPPHSGMVFVTKPTEVPPTAAATEPTTEAPEPEHFLLTFAGDCTLGANPVNWYAGCGFIKTIGEDYGHPFRNVASYFEEDDFTMVNLEGPLSDRGAPQKKKFTFRGPPAYVEILTGSSVEAVNLGNNHTLDYGRRAYDDTLAILDEAGVTYAEPDCSALFTTDNGLTIGLYAMRYYRSDTRGLAPALAALRDQGADLVVVACHWGAEGTYKANEVQTTVGHAAIDAGADIVFGTHPHVLQPVEFYGDGVIYYSLGNFSFGGNAYPDDFDTALLQQEVIQEPDGTVHLGDLTAIPACLSSNPRVNNYQPTPYEPGSEDYQRVMEKLGLSF